jgi:hypothetical protein
VRRSIRRLIRTGSRVHGRLVVELVPFLDARGEARMALTTGRMRGIVEREAEARARVTTWGWVLLIWGSMLMLAGFGLIGGQGWARGSRSWP